MASFDVKRRSGMADRFHFIRKRLSPATGDHVPNPMDANQGCFDVVFFDHAGQSKAISCKYGATLPPGGHQFFHQL